ncbi:MAG: 3-isopropylmalate dehydratase small subunit [Gemmataceae bacterium]|nr:3-isopropylmalate dehydratase small subunit [Gemmataceae bacterium]MDW8266779.1 3-isopropylmalate dehydratase small subunit [Gemmataceae bacterium]
MSAPSEVPDRPVALVVRIAAMQPFTIHTGRFIALDRANIDTDAIIPARFLKKIERTGFGELLFMDLRRRDGQLDPAFPLNRPEAAEASILVARQNFGCGSSREHAVWAIQQAGFRAVVAPRVGDTPAFADIFRTNSYKNGLLPVEVSEPFARRLLAAGTGQLTIDLNQQRLTAHLPDGDFAEPFSIPEGTRRMLLEGLDEIGLTLRHEADIAAYEARHPDLAPVESPAP